MQQIDVLRQHACVFNDAVIILCLPWCVGVRRDMDNYGGVLLSHAIHLFVVAACCP